MCISKSVSSIPGEGSGELVEEPLNSKVIKSFVP